MASATAQITKQLLLAAHEHIRALYGAYPRKLKNHLQHQNHKACSGQTGLNWSFALLLGPDFKVSEGASQRHQQELKESDSHVVCESVDEC